LGKVEVKIKERECLCDVHNYVKNNKEILKTKFFLKMGKSVGVVAA
jgi:hypothetical protein